MTITIILLAIIASYFGFYWFFSEGIEKPNNEILNKLKWIEKQNNMIREDINDLRLQLDEMWKDVKYIKNNIDNNN